MNISELMEAVLPEALLKLIKRIGLEADKKELGVYLVGGIVRDLFLGRENFDIDIVVSKDSLEFAGNFGKILSASVKLHERFKTATVVLPNNIVIDIARARTENYKQPGGLPQVFMSDSIRKDMKRRDFTINGLAINIAANNFGELLDIFNGVEDIKEKKIKVLHDLSFKDDPTRILRAVRFEQRLGFSLEDNTRKLLIEAVKQGALNTVSAYRIKKEKNLILKECVSDKIIKRMNELGI